MINIVQYFCVEVFYCIIEKSLFGSSNFRIYEETLTWTELLFTIHIINFTDDIFKNNFCYPSKKVLLTVLMLS